MHTAAKFQRWAAETSFRGMTTLLQARLTHWAAVKYPPDRSAAVEADARRVGRKRDSFANLCIIFLFMRDRLAAKKSLRLLLTAPA
jgi:hypothetical protein